MSHPYGTFDDKMPHHDKCHQMLSKGGDEYAWHWLIEPLENAIM